MRIQFKSVFGWEIKPSNYIFPLDITIDGKIRTIYFVDDTPPNNGKFDPANDELDNSGFMSYLLHILIFHSQNETDIRRNLQEVKDKLRNSGRLQSGRQMTNSDSF